MHFLLISFIAAIISGCFAQFDPFTVTGLTPEQVSKINQLNNG
jgi:hypothetical protein